MNFAETKRYNEVSNKVHNFITKFNLKDNEECVHLIIALVNGVVGIQHAILEIKSSKEDVQDVMQEMLEVLANNARNARSVGEENYQIGEPQ